MLKNNKYLDVIDKIEAVRTKNNKNWMDLLRLAFEHAPAEAGIIFTEIFKEDKEVNRLAQKLLQRDD